MNVTNHLNYGTWALSSVFSKNRRSIGASAALGFLGTLPFAAVRQSLGGGPPAAVCGAAYWEGGKGCAVGCTIHSADHNQYEKKLGIPIWLARVEDRLFEGMSNKSAKAWPEQFLRAINPGADLNKVRAPF